MGRTSYEDIKKYKIWEKLNNNQTSLIPIDNKTLSNKEEIRFFIYKYVIKFTSSKKYRISFKSTNGLKSRFPAFPLNFWLYTPQHKDDSAPIKNKNK